VFTHNGGGYATLSFVPRWNDDPGLDCRGWLRRLPAPGDRVRLFLMVGLAGLALGWLLNLAGVCPNVKRIWTPTW